MPGHCASAGGPGANVERAIRSLANQYLVMERGEIVKRGAGADMDRDGVKQLLAV